MITTQWLVRYMLAVTAVHASFHGHELQEPLSSESLQQTEPPHSFACTGDVDDPCYEPLFTLHRDLVNIDSVSGHEQAVGIFLERYLQGLNYTVERQHVGPLIKDVNCSPESNWNCGEEHQPQQQNQKVERFNLLAHPPGHRRTPILLTTHIDTVPPFYAYSHHHHSLRGRGIVDAKASVAAQIYAAQSLLHSSLVPSTALSHLFVVGEEVGGDGMMAASRGLNLNWDTVIFGEPTELRLASGHKGILIFILRAHGKAAHSGYPWLGSSATGLLVKALAALQNLQLPWSEKYGNTTLNIGTLEGGMAANVMAENASAAIGIRIAEGNSEDVKKLVLETVRSVSNTSDDGDLDVHFYGGAYGPVDIDADIPGFETMTVNYATDIPNLEGDHKRYLYGPGSILVAHSDHEVLDAKDLTEAVKGYKKIILHAAGELK